MEMNGISENVPMSGHWIVTKMLNLEKWKGREMGRSTSYFPFVMYVYHTDSSLTFGYW